MVVTITAATGEVFTFNDGDVENITSEISTMLDHDAMPLSYPLDAMLYDLNGVLKVVQISGQISNSGTTRSSTQTIITINEQRQWLEKLMDGNQAGYSFDSNYTSTWNGSIWVQSRVLISRIRFSEITGNPNNLPFEITILVGSV